MGDSTRQTLSEALLKVRRRIQQTRERREGIGEQNTKATLIDPILSALGWDIQELDEVSREYRRKPQDNPVDYALFLLRSPRLFVEAKALEKDLNDRRWASQILGYATVVGVEWCVLTNGDEYRLYNSHAAVDVDEKLFRTVCISDPTQEQHTLDTLELLSKDKMGENILSVLWNAHFIDRNVGIALRDLLHNEDAGLVRLIRKKTPGLSPLEIKGALKRADIRIDFPAVTLTPAPTVITGEQPLKPGGKARKRAPKQGRTTIADAIAAGLIMPPLEIEVQFKKKRVTATLNSDGTITFDGQIYDSPSTAAGMVRNSVSGPPPDGRSIWQTNGWTFWRYRDRTTGDLLRLDHLRELLNTGSV